jgi:hypothetical protein
MAMTTDRPRLVRIIAAVVVFGLMMAPGTATAQLMLTPILGVYVPTANLYEVPGSIGTARQKTSFMGGARLMVSASGQLGIEAGVLYGPAGISVTTTAGTVSRSANVTLAHLRLVYVLNSEWAAVNVYIAGGAAVVKRGGEAFQDVEGLTDVGGNLALGTIFRLGSAFRARLEIEDYIYQTEFTFPDGETSGPRLQNDVVFTFGVSIPIG